MDPYQLVNIVLNVTFITTFLAIVSITYGKTIQEHIATQNNDILKEYITKNITTLFDKQAAENIASQLTTQTETVIQEPDNREQLKLIGAIFIIGILIAIALGKYYRFGITHLIQSNLTTLAIVAIAQYVFFNYIAKEFVSVDPNFVKHRIVRSLKSSIQQHTIQTPITVDQSNEILAKKLEEIHGTFPTLGDH